jgi:hypothetical protein
MTIGTGRLEKAALRSENPNFERQKIVLTNGE